ncbi:uncharacterized protein LOC124253631 [Haliotis rubra]|uniref:uncharacterized protein LOC124253631 n=1 Tax=Haliotis rubra TaxID=36100 RepID=UPI001EE52F6A|nr:uncharacterized protein LOC124253631 [Haliotis rubra]XP_046543392.1 uncharacterized protein LOC124253631 [Haliotis rubra]
MALECGPGTDNVDSDDDDIASTRHVLIRGVQRIWTVSSNKKRGHSLFKPYKIRVYDIRGKNAIVRGKITGFRGRNKKDMAAHHGLNEEYVYFNPQKDSAVLHDNADLLILFINFQLNQKEASSSPFTPGPHYTEVSLARGCIGLAPDTSIGTLKTVIRDDKLFNKDKFPCLFLKGKRCDEDSSMAGSLFTNGDVVACYAKSDVMIQCFYVPRPNVEHKYEFACFSTDNVGEMKQAFKKSFCREFPGLASGIDDVWFSVGNQLLKDKEYFSLTLQRRRPLSLKGRLVVHVKQASSFPLTLKMISQEHSSQIMLISAPVTTAELREEVSDLIKQPPNALHLYTKNKKLKEMVLSKSAGIHPKGVVLVKVAKKMQVLVSLQTDGSTQKIALQLFKLDSVLRLKEILQEHAYATVSQLQLFFNQNELENERLMQDYRIREDDIISACVFSMPDFIVVRQPGRERLHLIIDGLQYTIGRLKEYLAHTLGCSYVLLNMIHRGRCLPDDDTLEHCGLVSGSTVLIPRLATQDQSANERILKVYMSQEDGTFQIAFAKEAAGILFYAPESVHSDRFEKHATKSVAQNEDYRRGIMLRRCKEIHPCKPKPIHQSEVIHQHGSRSLTARSDPLAQNLSSCTVQRKRKHPQGLPHAHPDLTGHRPHPKALRLDTECKKYMYRKELSENGGRYILREESTLDVCKSNADEVFPHIALTPSVMSPEKVVSTSPEHAIHRSPSLQSPVEAIQNSVLLAVAKELGNDWKQVALALGLQSSDIDDVEYRHSRELREQAWHALILWKKRNSRNATIVSLKKALRDCGLALTADSIDESIKYETV